MRIVHILTRLMRAGAEENTLLTITGQLAEGHEVILMHGPQSEPERAGARLPALRLIEIPGLVREISPAQDWRAYAAIRDRLREVAPDVVHTHQSKAGILGRFAAHAAKVPAVVHGVHILPFLGETGAKKAVYLGLEKAAARVTHGFIHVSQGMQDACDSHGVGKDRRHDIIRSGFDLERFAKASPPDDWRALLGVGADQEKPLVLSMLAALESRKRHMELLDILPDFIRAHPDARIIFAGEGPLARAVEDKARALGIGDNIRLTGFRSDPESIIALSDICLLSSAREGLPRSVLQYLAGGRAPVLFDLPGIGEIIRNGENGVIIASDDWAGYLGQLKQLAADPAQREAIARAAGETDLGAWDWRMMGEKTNAVYRAILDDQADGTAFGKAAE